MARRHTSPKSLYDAQLARFKAVGKNAKAGMYILKRDALDEMETLVNGGSGVAGKARIKALRAAGHPFGRNNTAMDTGSRRFGGKRGVANRVGGFPQLPIGVISGKLKKSKFATVKDFQLTLGFDKSAGPSIAAVYPFGTNRTVGRGLMLPGEKGALGKRMKRSRLAFKKAFFEPLKKPSQ